MSQYFPFFTLQLHVGTFWYFIFNSISSYDTTRAISWWKLTTISQQQKHVNQGRWYNNPEQNAKFALDVGTFSDSYAINDCNGSAFSSTVATVNAYVSFRSWPLIRDWHISIQTLFHPYFPTTAAFHLSKNKMFCFKSTVSSFVFLLFQISPFIIYHVHKKYTSY
jgi:hypothetical protein